MQECVYTLYKEVIRNASKNTIIFILFVLYLRISPYLLILIININGSCANHIDYPGMCLFTTENR